jgi:hypothetical protein
LCQLFSTYQIPVLIYLVRTFIYPSYYIF